MFKSTVVAVLLMTTAASATTFSDDFENEPMCKVEVCNKLERFTLDIWSHIKDQMGEMCMEIVVPKSKAVPGSVLSEESRWYQGSFNPTKKSVTRIKQVIKCQGDSNE